MENEKPLKDYLSDLKLLKEYLNIMCEELQNTCMEVLEAEQDVLMRDLDCSIDMLRGKPASIIEGTPETEPELKVTDVLDAHMDTMVKTVINMLVCAITEMALDKNEIEYTLPPLVEYIQANREKYNLN